MKLLPVHLHGDIGQEVPVAEAVKVEKDVTRMACELDTAVSSRVHAFEVWETSYNKICVNALQIIFNSVKNV